ncbi:hypothetical protein [Bosea sp. (in: a-proteobacteria)]|uniref:hypothetical protein n=1 Tax=Bosea sp. (in: a-proteobacteria) TaxID=1871050 RepID=UPI002B491831|nr:hypothetical protein [Bosea sp. (in: a-proteobacteria)]WRH59304.1 MAG: hypothetical protein RSE11_05855 [Bosea sp. (in: a-proteobacteria)]
MSVTPRRLTNGPRETDPYLNTLRLCDATNYIDIRQGLDCSLIMSALLHHDPSLQEAVSRLFISPPSRAAVGTIKRMTEALVSSPINPIELETRSERSVARWFYLELSKDDERDDEECGDDDPFSFMAEAARRLRRATDLAERYKPRRGSPGQLMGSQLDAVLMGVTYMHWRDGGSLSLPSNEPADGHAGHTELSSIACDAVTKVAAALTVTRRASSDTDLAAGIKWLSGLKPRQVVDRLRPIVREFV